MRVRRWSLALFAAPLAALGVAGCASQSSDAPPLIKPIEVKPVAKEPLVLVTLTPVHLEIVKSGLKPKVKDLTGLDKVKAGRHKTTGAITVCGQALTKSSRIPFTGNFLDVKGKTGPATTFVPLSIATTDADRHAVAKVCTEDGLG